MKFILKLTVILFAGVIFSACCKAGTGGNAKLSCTVLVDGRPVKGAVVYIAYGTSTAPTSGLGGFDNHVTAASNTNTVVFTGLKCGTYYLYATGNDTVSNAAVPVAGGGPYSLLHSDRNKSESTTLNITY